MLIVFERILGPIGLLIMCAATHCIVVHPAFNVIVVLRAIHGVITIYGFLFGVRFGAVIVDGAGDFLIVSVAHVAITGDFFMATGDDLAILSDGIVMIQNSVVVMDLLLSILDAATGRNRPVRLADGAIFFDIDSARPIYVGHSNIAFFGRKDEPCTYGDTCNERYNQ